LRRPNSFVPPDSPLKGWSKPVWETECAPFGFQPWDPAWDDGSLWGVDTAGLTAPNTGLVEVEGSTVATSGRLWAFAGYSRFIRPGAVRIGATTSATASM
jgi:hypothetical protein